MSVKGYKGFKKDLTCRGMQFEIGQTYEMAESPSVCNRGFHFCEKIADVHDYYLLGDSRVCEVEAIGEIVKEGNKSATNKIVIIRELSREEIRTLANTGNDNTGYRNSGHGNSGQFNSCDNSAGTFMSKRISYEAFNKSLSRGEYTELICSRGYHICQQFQLVKYRVRTRTGKFRDFRYLGYKKSWQYFWNNLSFTQRMAIRNMPHFDKDVFYEITGIKA